MRSAVNAQLFLQVFKQKHLQITQKLLGINAFLQRCSSLKMMCLIKQKVWEWKPKALDVIFRSVNPRVPQEQRVLLFVQRKVMKEEMKLRKCFTILKIHIFFFFLQWPFKRYHHVSSLGHFDLVMYGAPLVSKTLFVKLSVELN